MGDGLYTGWSNPPLSEKGRALASDLSGHQMLRNIDKIYTSPSDRCLQTLEQLSLPLSIPRISDDRLREINFGQWEGLNYQEINRKWPEEWEQWCLNINENKPPEGESQIDLLERTGKFLKEKQLGSSKGKILISAHGGSLAALLKHLVFSDTNELYKIMPRRTSLTTLSVQTEYRFSITSFNIAFLKRPC